MIAAMVRVFGKEADDPMYEGYKIGLEDLPLGIIRTGVSRAIRECRFMPTVADLRELAGDVSPESRAQLAWGVLEKTIRLVGYYGSVDFDDKCINATVHHLGGWEKVCSTGDLPEDQQERAQNDWAWLRREFEKAYARFYRSGISADSARPCIGCHDRTNANSGYGDRVSTPQLIACGLPQTRKVIRESTMPIKRLPGASDGPKLLGDLLQ